MGLRAKENGKSEGRPVMGRIGVMSQDNIIPRESEQARHEVADVIVVSQRKGNNLLFCQ
jgi:hypothetical protein